MKQKGVKSFNKKNNINYNISKNINQKGNNLIKSNQIKKCANFIELIVVFFKKVGRDDIFALSAQLAYYLILSFFPFLIFLMNLIGFSNLDSSQVIEGLKGLLPSSVFELTSSIIVEVVDTQHTGILGISILVTIWAASSAFRAAIKGINKAYNVKENRSFIKRVFIGMISTVAMAFVVILSLLLLVFGELIGELMISKLPFDGLISILWNIARYLIVIFAMISIFASIYKFSPCKKIAWKEVIPGAIISTVGWISVSIIFSFYINNFSNYSRLYGSLGAVFALMTWLYITSIIFIIGGEINAVLMVEAKVK